MPQGQRNETKNRRNIVTNSIKTLKMVHIKKKKKKNTLKQPAKRTPSGISAGKHGPRVFAEGVLTPFHLLHHLAFSGFTGLRQCSRVLGSNPNLAF